MTKEDLSEAILDLMKSNEGLGIVFFIFSAESSEIEHTHLLPPPFIPEKCYEAIHTIVCTGPEDSNEKDEVLIVPIPEKVEEEYDIIRTGLHLEEREHLILSVFPSPAIISLIARRYMKAHPEWLEGGKEIGFDRSTGELIILKRKDGLAPPSITLFNASSSKH